ncbi:MAG: HYR domain-containing protein, partial [Nitrospirae bacterium]|nr:HYR domain-containing protein [Nitrospirota bacterium]
GTGAKDALSVPQVTQSVSYGWDTQAEFDLWHKSPGSDPGMVAQWVASGGLDGSGYLHLEMGQGQWGEFSIPAAHLSWYLSDGARVDVRNNGSSPLRVNLMINTGSGGVSKWLSNEGFDQNGNWFSNPVPADGQWHRIWLPDISQNIWPGDGSAYTGISFNSVDGSAVTVDVDTLTNGCEWCGPILGDSDGDGISNPIDNAPYAYNPDQLDSDGDGVGDVADAYPIDPNMSDPDPNIPPTDGSANVGADGFTFSTADGNLNIVVPPDAVPTDTTITVAQDPSGQGGITVETTSGPGELIAAYELIPSGLTFAQPVTLVFYYDDQAVDENNLAVFWFNPNTNQYDPLPFTQDFYLNTLSIQVDHFSRYAVIEMLDSIPPTINATLSPLPNLAGWNNTDVSVTFSCSDAETGIASCPSIVTVTEEGAGHVITGTAVDVAGNSTVASVTVNIDKTLPIVVCPIDTEILALELTGTPVTSPDIQTFLDGASAIDLNQIVSFTNDAPDFFNMGTTSVTFIATDIAGNTSMCQATVIVNDPAPVFDSIGTQIVNESQTLELVISATDANDQTGDGLIYSVAGLPTGAVFDPQTGIFSYTPGHNVSTPQSDTSFDVTFTVNDGTNIVDMLVNIIIHNVNQPPVANAGLDIQLECAGAVCAVVLNGTDSTDPDSYETYNDIDKYEWFEGQQPLGTGSLISTDLSIGVHDVTLKVTDRSGAFGTDTIRITIDPAHLSMLVLDKAEIDWPKTSGALAEVKLHGRMALPAGLLLQELAPYAGIRLNVAGQSDVLSQATSFVVKGEDGEKWEFKSNQSGHGIQQFFIHWKGAKFDYNGTIHLKTEFISLTETALSIDRENITEPITITVNGVTASIDAIGNVTTSVSYEIDEDGEVTLILPFELTPNMEITITIGTQSPITILSGDYYSPGSGKFELKAKVDPGTLTGASRPAILEMNLTLGNEGFPGSVSISEGGWKTLSTKEWKADLKK